CECLGVRPPEALVSADYWDGDSSLVPGLLPVALEDPRVIRQFGGDPPLRHRHATRERELVRRSPQDRASSRQTLVPPVGAENANRLLARRARGGCARQTVRAVR